jgi:F-type H+-transporting ATPase subunit epsilon
MASTSHAHAPQAHTLHFELVTPERVALSGEARQVVVPGLEGRFTVLPGHAPVISTLRPGMVEVALEGTDKRRFFVKGGIVELDGVQLTILAERVLEEEAMDAQRRAAELEAARAEFAAASDDTARLAAASALELFGAQQR